MQIIEPNAADLDVVDITCECGNSSDIPRDACFALRDMHCGQCEKPGLWKVKEKEQSKQASGYTSPIARSGEQQFACIMRNRSGESSGTIDFGARFIDDLSDGDQQDAVNAAFAVYEKWCRETEKKATRDNS